MTCDCCDAQATHIVFDEGDYCVGCLLDFFATCADVISPMDWEQRGEAVLCVWYDECRNPTRSVVQPKEDDLEGLGDWLDKGNGYAEHYRDGHVAEAVPINEDIADWEDDDAGLC